MLTVRKMIERIRAETHDQQEVGYADEDLIHYLNDGVRFLRRTILTINPFLLVNMEQDGKLMKGAKDIVLDAMPSHICSVRVNGALLQQGNPLLIDDTTEVGQPTQYFLQGLQKIRVYPVPDVDYSYEILAIKDVPRLESTDEKSPFPDDFDDWLYEYAVLRASMANEFDMTQETSVMSTIVQQVQEVLYGMSPIGIETNGYIGSGGLYPSRRRRYY